MTAKGYGIAWNNPITEGDGNGKIEPALACVFEPTREIQKFSRKVGVFTLSEQRDRRRILPVSVSKHQYVENNAYKISRWMCQLRMMKSETGELSSDTFGVGDLHLSNLFDGLRML